MFDYIFLTGLMGSLALVTGAAWPEGKKTEHPIKSIKNWLFAIGGLTMLLYAIMGYMVGGVIFFVFLQIFLVLASVLMMLNAGDKIAIIAMSVCGSGFLFSSLYLFEGYNTIFFIIGLTGIGLGYTLKTGTVYRSLALTLGSALIALFSYFEANWIFFWLNLFFAIFSGYYLLRIIRQK